MNIMLARQPIFDLWDHVAAYELLSRSTDSASDAGSSDSAADQTLVDAFLGAGLETVTGGLPAVVTVSRELLLRGALELLNPHQLIIQIKVPEAPDDELCGVAERLAAAGYRFALTGNLRSPYIEPLIALRPFVKIDMRTQDPELPGLTASLREQHALLLADNVANRAVHESCKQLGFEFFSGVLFSRPETMTGRDISIEHLRAFRLMRKVRDLYTTDTEIEEEFCGDVALTYKLLRMVNSAACGGRGLRSIGHAVRMLGRDALYRWLGLLLIAPVKDSGVDAEITMVTLLRARMCELMADAGSRPLAGGTLFMLGLLSALDTYMGIPVDTIKENLGLAPELEAALDGRRGPFGAALALVEAYEDGRWDDAAERAAEIGVPEAELPALYMNALHWADERRRSGAWSNSDADEPALAVI